MRLIDADDLLKAFEALELMNGEYAESFTNMAGNRSMEIECAKDYIYNAKTIDAVPVVHAHWIAECNPEELDSSTYCRCSNCGASAPIGFTFDWDFCPYCGAKMDEEDGHEKVVCIN